MSNRQRITCQNIGVFCFVKLNIDSDADRIALSSLLNSRNFIEITPGTEIMVDKFQMFTKNDLTEYS